MSKRFSMNIFIKVNIINKKCIGIKECGQCINVCPVSIFDKRANEPIIVQNNEDECTLCDLCLNSCPTDAVQIIKLYEK
jgi:ferredoxin